MPGWMKHKLESRLTGKISTTSDKQTYQPKGGSEVELKGFLRVKEESEKLAWNSTLEKKKN